MSIVVRHEGIEYVCASAKEAAELSVLLRAQPVPTHAITTAKQAAEVISERESRSPMGDAPTSSPGRLLLMLQMLAANPSGIPNDDLIVRLGFKSTKALGPFMGYIRQQVGSLGFGPSDDIVYRERQPGGEIRWFPGSKIIEAIEKLQASNPSLFGEGE